MDKLCVIKIRSDIRCSKTVLRSMETLGLNKLYSCSVINKSDQSMGILKHVDSWITYGEIDKDTLKKLLKRRSMSSNRKSVDWKDDELDDFVNKFYEGKKTFKDVNVKRTFHLHPPIKGFERKGKKTPFSLHGAYGYRGVELNKLLERMI